jgi:hypothetical protein
MRPSPHGKTCRERRPSSRSPCNGASTRTSTRRWPVCAPTVRPEEVTYQQIFEWFIGEERAEKGQEPPQPFHLFRVEIDEIVLTTLRGDPPDHLVIETWRERRGTTSNAADTSGEPL